MQTRGDEIKYEQREKINSEQQEMDSFLVNKVLTNTTVKAPRLSHSSTMKSSSGNTTSMITEDIYTTEVP